MDESNLFLRVLAAYSDAVRVKDVDAFTALYDQDIHVFDMWGTWSLRGLAAWRDMAAGWFSSLGDECVVVTSDDESSAVAGALAIGHAVLTYTEIAPDGTKLRSLSNRVTMALRKTGGSWKIIHEHTSAPIDHQSQQAILHRSDD
ncbi:ketosteroid isomerase [Jeongeupia sp. HS-3]|uniref:YybH family protein n=1 Tax=Jeongeupia sp. HS-3 TaxID=1009682 RepID=UPI0018A6546B|nr:nuclear transport factor 2 family protein [Jeongeupia sp. HS-3]BCL75613.1 ketosteroid isomerase [Jeongeupia sp. HS-3]